MSDKNPLRLPKLSDTQKLWIIEMRAMGMAYEEIAGSFREVYTDYVPDIPQETFIPAFGDRIRSYINCSQPSAKAYIDAKSAGELPINIEALPMCFAHVRIMRLSRLLDKIPEEKEYARDFAVIFKLLDKQLERLGIHIANESNIFLGDAVKGMELIDPPWGTSDVDKEQTEQEIAAGTQS